MTGRAPLLLFALPLLSGLALAKGEPIPLDGTPRKGTRSEVVEARDSQLTVKWKSADGSGTKQEVKRLRQRFRQEVLSPKPWTFLRNYEESTQESGQSAQELASQRTSLHGRAVVLQGLELKPQGAPFQISKEDRDRLKLYRLARAFLDGRELKPRGSYKLGPEPFLKALVGDFVPASVGKGGAKVRLESVREGEQGKIARLAVKLNLRTERHAQLPEIHLDLKGKLEWNLNERDLAEGELEGTMGVFVVNEKEGASWQATGPLRWTYRAKFLLSRSKGDGEAARKEGRPPAPGVKLLICSKDPKHRISVADVRNCPRCGAALDAERACPKDHRWVLQYCPQDGAPFRHQE